MHFFEGGLDFHDLTTNLHTQATGEVSNISAN
jgi:hypothetical protein